MAQCHSAPHYCMVACSPRPPRCYQLCTALRGPHSRLYSRGAAHNRDGSRERYQAAAGRGLLMRRVTGCVGRGRLGYTPHRGLAMQTVTGGVGMRRPGASCVTWKENRRELHRGQYWNIMIRQYKHTQGQFIKKRVAPLMTESRRYVHVKIPCDMIYPMHHPHLISQVSLVVIISSCQDPNNASSVT